MSLYSSYNSSTVPSGALPMLNTGDAPPASDSSKIIGLSLAIGSGQFSHLFAPSSQVLLPQHLYFILFAFFYSFTLWTYISALYLIFHSIIKKSSFFPTRFLLAGLLCFSQPFQRLKVEQLTSTVYFVVRQRPSHPSQTYISPTKKKSSA